MIERISAGTDVVMDIDVQGAAQVRAIRDEAITRALVDVFVMPADEAELESRLTGRGTDSAEVIALRLRNAIDEMKHWREYRYAIVSDTQEADFERFCMILNSERMKASRMRTPAGLVGNIPQEQDLPEELITAEQEELF